MEVAAAPTAVFIVVKDGFELVFLGKQLPELQTHGGIDDSLIQNGLLAVEQLYDDLGVFRRHYSDEDVAQIGLLGPPELETDRVVGATADTEKDGV